MLDIYLLLMTKNNGKKLSFAKLSYEYSRSCNNVVLNVFGVNKLYEFDAKRAFLFVIQL